MLLLDIPPMLHRIRYRHNVVARDVVDHRHRRPQWTGQMRLPMTHHECLTCGKVWLLDV